MSLRGGDPNPRFDGPSEGLPPWLKGPVLEWVRSAFLSGGYVNDEALRALQLDFRLDWMVHYHKYFSSGHQSQEWVGELGVLLNQGGSAWEVITLDYMSHRLTRRAVGPVVEVLEQSATEATRAHKHLSDSWSKLMGRGPIPPAPTARLCVPLRLLRSRSSFQTTTGRRSARWKASGRDNSIGTELTTRRSH